MQRGVDPLRSGGNDDGAPYHGTARLLCRLVLWLALAACDEDGLAMHRRITAGATCVDQILDHGGEGGKVGAGHALGGLQPMQAVSTKD